MNRSKKPGQRNSLREASVATVEPGRKPKLFDTSIVSDPQEAVDCITNIYHEFPAAYLVIARPLQDYERVVWSSATNWEPIVTSKCRWISTNFERQ